MKLETSTLYHGDAMDLLEALPDESVDLVATDPPFNIGLKYDLYQDRIGYSGYVDWSKRWISEASRSLKASGSMFICIGDEYAAEVNLAMKEAGLHFRNWLIWYYTFGESQRKKFNRCHTHILYFTKSPSGFTFNADAVKVPSARQLIYKDKRAKAGGKLPDDVWTISRVCGTFQERILDEDGSAHPCQMPRAVMERIVKCSTDPGALVVDPFAGTGTTLDAAQRLGRRFIGCELSEQYVRVSAQRCFEDSEQFARLERALPVRNAA